MKIRYLHAGYGIDANLDHIAVPPQTEKKLLQMARDLVGTDDLIAIYVPLMTPEIYGAAMPMRGKVVGAVKLLPMPDGRNIREYYFDDWSDGTRRWPIGWPREVVLFPPPQARFDLKPLVELVYGAGQFSPYAAMFQAGPIEVRPDLGERLVGRLLPYRRAVKPR